MSEPFLAEVPDFLAEFQLGGSCGFGGWWGLLGVLSPSEDGSQQEDERNGRQGFQAVVHGSYSCSVRDTGAHWSNV